MPFVKISSDVHKDMKQYLVDIDGISLGELIEGAYYFAMENLAKFEKFFEIEKSDESTDDTKKGDEDDSDKDDEDTEEEDDTEKEDETEKDAY